MAQDDEGWYSVPAADFIQSDQSESDWVELPGLVSPVRFDERGEVVPRVRASFRPSVRIEMSASGYIISSEVLPNKKKEKKKFQVVTAVPGWLSV